MPFFVLSDGEFGRIEAEATQEDVDEPLRQEGEATGHELPFLVGDGHLGQMFQLFTKKEVEPLGITRAVSVEKLILRFRPRVLLEDVIHARKGI